MTAIRPLVTRRPKRMRLRAGLREGFDGSRTFRGADGTALTICFRDWVGLDRPDAIEIEITQTRSGALPSPDGLGF